MEALVNPISVENTKDRTKPLINSKVDFDYAYGRKNGQCFSQPQEEDSTAFTNWKKNFYRLADIPTLLQEKKTQP